ncbi:cytochrome b561 [Solimonas aquatica]|uniref:Cytochrome b561 n=1 Tax=Solimonas aquatica TaxID=489703 RepID=A0A1H9KQY8_9GAMM|nr:cytochrome b [Solimonas aquatica]SER01586.1 cytochrome b561 [Solimonas aquatica]
MNTVPETHYSATAKWLHWLTLLLMLGGYTLGFIMADLPVSPTRLKMFVSHKWIGVTVFLLSLIRVLWRLAVPPPQPVAMPAWQRLASEYTHRAIYLMLFLLPLSGWLMSSAHGFQTVYLGVLPIPDLLHKDKALAETLEEVHESFALLMLALLAVHVAAALKHHLIDHDGSLRRMLPRRGA